MKQTVNLIGILRPFISFYSECGIINSLRGTKRTKIITFEGKCKITTSLIQANIIVGGVDDDDDIQKIIKLAM